MNGLDWRRNAQAHRSRFLTDDTSAQRRVAHLRQRQPIEINRQTVAAVRCSRLLGCSLPPKGIIDIMTRTLDDAIAKISALPPEEQDRIARWLLDELKDEERWDSQFSESQDALKELADEAREDRAAGRTTELDPDRL
jgi:hypothetical protein